LARKGLLGLVLVLALAVTAVSLGSCLPTGGEEGDFTTTMWPMLIFIVVLFGLMYFLMIRPQRRRQKEHEDLVEQLQRGDRVITAGGIHGQIESVSEDSVVLKVESGASMRVAKTSIIIKQGEREPKVG